MIITMKIGASSDSVKKVAKEIEKHDPEVTTEIIKGEERKIIAVKGSIKYDEGFVSHLKSLENVDDVKILSTKFKLSSIEAGNGNGNLVTIQKKVGGKNIKVTFGGDQFPVISGPCSLENRNQIDITIAHLSAMGIAVIRAGVFKPRTSPGNFEGLWEDGLKILAEMREKYRVLVATELLDPRHADLFLKHNVDIVQIGTRNMANYELLKEAGRLNLPVILKRGWAATYEEWLQAADYILREQADKQVILCERGIRTYEPMTRNTLDVCAVPIMKKISWLPIIIDPSHPAGEASLVPSLSLCAVAVGADGLIIEVHNNPKKALTDGAQSLDFGEFATLYHDMKKFVAIQKRKLV